MSPYARLSFWHDSIVRSGADGLVPRPPLSGSLTADVCIVGGGFTGLWTAYHLLRAGPGLRVVVLEAEIAGFGASGRNGGWCSALFPTSVEALERAHGHDRAAAMRRAMHGTLDEIETVLREEEIACDWRRGGTLVMARSAVQERRLRAEVAADEARGGLESLEWIGPGAARERLDVTRGRGALFTPHCARVHPAKLVRGLARAVERHGGTVAERTRVLDLRPRAADGFARVVTDHGTVRAGAVVRATEAWTPRLPGHARDVVPVYSLMIATEPLGPDFWAATGLARGETFSDGRHLIIYGQRTADDRIAFGGRGAPYHWGSTVRPDFDREPRVFSALRRTLVDLFPAAAGARITHAWGGPLGIARDWNASVGLDRTTGIGWAGGYVGDGVGTTNLAGRTLADLVLERDTPLTDLPWVDHRSPRWEPEPLRWLGANAGLRAMTLADREESLTGRESLVARVMAPLLGH